MTAKKTPATQAPTPSPLLDAYGNPSLVSAGQLIESAWGNAVVGRVLYRFPNQGALNAFSAATGSLAVTTDLNVVWIRDGANWLPTAIGNVVRFTVTGGGAGQLVTPGTVTVCTWATEVLDPSGVMNAGVFTVPGGWGGRWMFEWGVNFHASGAGSRQCALSINGAVRRGQDTRVSEPGQAVDMTGAVSLILAAGATASVIVYETLDNSMVVNASSDQYFQGYYVGPF